MGPNKDHKLLDICYNIFTLDIKQYIHNGISTFRDWKRKDNIQLRNEMFHAYHRLGLDKKEENKMHRESILKDAFKIGGQEFVNQIKSYQSTVVNINKSLKI